MTTEDKALALVNEVLAEWGVLKKAVEVPKNSDAFARALLRAIEQHEAFRQEVSDAMEHCRACSDPEAWTRIKFELERFIITKPDPLVEAMAACGVDRFESWAGQLYAALDALDFEIREKGQ
jgi:hypothetical protein